MTQTLTLNESPALAPRRPAISAGRLAMLLFIASEVMFFAALLAAYVVLRSAAPKVFAEHSKLLDVRSGAINTAILLLSSLAMAMGVRAARQGRHGRAAILLAITLVLGAAFPGVKYREYAAKFHDYTVLARGDSIARIKVDASEGVKLIAVLREGNRVFNPVADPGKAFGTFTKGKLASYGIPLERAADGTYSAKIPWAAAGGTIQVYDADKAEQLKDAIVEWSGGMFIYDGERVAVDTIMVEGEEPRELAWRMDGRRREVSAAEPIDVYAYTPIADGKLGPSQSIVIPTAAINDSVWYGPQKSAFFACYYVLTGAHVLHLIGGMIPLLVLLIMALARRTPAGATANVGLYWQFVDVVWLVLFPLLYLIG